MAEKTGKRRKLVCKLQGQQIVCEIEEDTNKIAEEAEALLGIKIDIE